MIEDYSESYICEYCNTSYRNKDIAEKCEAHGKQIHEAKKYPTESWFLLEEPRTKESSILFVNKIVIQQNTTCCLNATVFIAPRKESSSMFRYPICTEKDEYYNRYLVKEILTIEEAFEKYKVLPFVSEVTGENKEMVLKLEEKVLKEKWEELKKKIDNDIRADYRIENYFLEEYHYYGVNIDDNRVNINIDKATKLI